ncbi:MAG: VWA domain-containing protein, partial [Acidobacteriaceae bacterium]
MHLRWGLVSFALLSCPFPFHAQTVPAEGQAPAATFKAETRAVAVDIVVLDSHGEPVKGLHKEDFVITENGAPQTANFFEAHPARLDTQDAATDVLLIDSLNTSKEDMSYVREQVGSFLKKMPLGSSLAVFSLGQTLRMVQGFTTDRAMLLTAVNDKKTGAWSESRSASNMPQDDAEDRERIEILRSMDQPRDSIDMVRNAQAIHKAYQSDLRIAMTLAALDRLARSLTKTPGRKSLIWFSGEFPLSVFQEPGVQGWLATTEQNRQIKDTINLLALARVAIYPVSAQGVAVQTTGDASDHYGTARDALPQSTSGVAVSTQSMGDNYQFGAVSNEMRREDGAHAANFAAMSALASETGGVMLPTSNDLSRMMARAIRDGSQYYTLSYAPTNSQADGSFRRIEVKMRNGSNTLAYRRGYYSTDTIFGTTAGTAMNAAKTDTAPTPHPAEGPASASTHTPASLASSAPSSLTTSSAPVSTTPSDAPRMPGLVHRTPEVVRQTIKANRRIHLDVTVMDPVGHAVSSLEQPDFTVLDDDRVRPIDSFRPVNGLTPKTPVEIVFVL